MLATAAAVGAIASVYLFLENRSLKSELADRERRLVTESTNNGKPSAAVAFADLSAEARQPSWAKTSNAVRSVQPQLPEEKQENRLDRRARRTEEFAAMFGRLEGETEEEYKARVGPLIAAGLALPRMRAADGRRYAEEKAGVTAEQSKKLDQAMENVYADVIDYTNKAIADGTLSPYERNVAGWLDFAGGLGGMLGQAQSQFGTILSPDQMKAMSAAGFEWGEYLGASAPWEKLNAPPPPRQK